MDMKALPGRVTTWFVLCSIVAVLHFAREFLLPVALAIFLAFVLMPVVRALERAKLPRIPATIVTMVGVGLLVVGLGWVLAGQVQNFAEAMPDYRANVRAKAADVRAVLQEPLEKASNTVRDLGRDLADPIESARTPIAAEPGSRSEDDSVLANGDAVGSMQEAVGSMASVAIVTGLVLLLACVILLRWEDLRDRMLAMAGEHDLESTSHAAEDASAKIGRYLRRQLLINGIHGVSMGLILWWIGVPSPLLWGLLGGVLRFVPYLGPLLGTGAPILVALASSDGWTETWVTAGALIALELVSNNLLEPWIYGAATGISPFALLVSTAFWTWIWGPVGLVLATPLTVCLLVVGKRFPSMRFLDVLFRAEPALSRRAQLYHRLLGNDQDGAWEILRQEIAHKSRIEACDQTLMPALGLASVARSDGRIDLEAREHIGALAHGLVDEMQELTQSPNSAANPLRVLCFPARDAFDAVGGRLLAQELTQRGHSASSSPASLLLAEVLEIVRRGEVDVVVISSVVPTHFLHVRSICKRLLALENDVQIVVGLWAEDLSIEEVRARLPASPRVRVTATLAEAIASIEYVVPRSAATRARHAATG